MAATVKQRLGWAERRIDLPAGRYDTILPPSSVADLMIDAYWGAGARVAHEGESVYSRRGGGTRIGDKVAAPGVSLFSDPAYAGLECAPFVIAGASDNTDSVFDNGLALERTDWIQDGLLTGLLQTRHSAGMTGQPVTPMIDNLVLEVGDGAGTIDDMVAGTQRGLLLTCLWYIREVDPQTMLLTGLTRDGVYVVEDGEIVGAANNFRWNESPIDLLNRFSAATDVGAELQPRVGRRLLLPHRHPGPADPRLQHVERVAGRLSPHGSPASAEPLHALAVACWSCRRRCRSRASWRCGRPSPGCPAPAAPR